MKNRLVILIGVLAALAVPEAARAACGALPYTFVNNASIVDAPTTNANNSFLQACATQVDNTQIGPAGIFPSQVVGSSTGTGTFGGGSSTFPYIFSLNSSTQVPLSVRANAAGTADALAVTNNAGTTKWVWVDSAGVLRGLTANFSGLITASGGVAFPINSTSTAGTNQVTLGVDGNATAVLRVQNIGTAPFKVQNADGTTTYATIGTSTASVAGTFAATQFNGSGAGLTAGTVPRASFVPMTGLRAVVTDAGGNDTTAVDLPVLLSTAQTVAGIKTFSSPPVMSGASITATTIPNAALVTTPVTAVTASGNLASSGGTTPAITIANAPTFSGVVTGLQYTSTGISTSPASGQVTLATDGNNALFRLNPSVSGTYQLQNFNGGTTWATFGPSSASVVGSLAISGALTGGTTGGFSSLVTAGGLALPLGSFSTPGTNQMTVGVDSSANGIFRLSNGTGVYQFQNGPGSSTYASFGTSAASVPGTFAAVGLTAGTGTVQGSSNASTVSYVPPVYTAAGVAVASTAHIVQGTSSIPAASSTVTITLTGAAVFASASSYSVQVTPNDSLINGPASPFLIHRTSGSSFTVTITSGTAGYGFDYVCVGA